MGIGGIAMQNLTNQQAAFLGMNVGMMLMVALIFYVIVVVATWKIFEKMGEPGWKSLIPFYNMYVLFDHIWIGILGPVATILMSCSTIFNQATQNGNTNTMLAMVVAIVTLIGAFIWSVGLYKLSKAFGKGIGFFFILFLFQGIGMLILGFGSDRYLGKPDDLQ